MRIAMSEMKNMGVKITLDIEREMVFNLNVLDACIDKFGKMDDILNNTAKDMEATRWLAVQMLNEGAEIHNDMHPDQKICLVDEARVKRYTCGLGGIAELQKKVQEAMLKGLPEEQVKAIEEYGKNLMAAQSQTKANRQQRRSSQK
jgi:cobalamin biosynthesis Co2+ chelatase CbiK